ncbi:uncharacterized protein LOC141719224 [Apium graveolens]|uniref:uncharacterized protein LOC141719224 n=1 Tax=Apium graveolens TaxID=4045 RepID=UPI003D79BC7D
MTLKDALADNDVIAGTLLLNSVDACVLINSDATKSFISENFVNKLGLKPIPLEKILAVEIVNKEVIPVGQVCQGCKIEIQGKPYYVDLIPFKLGEFDVIMVMDWLARADAQINYISKRVSLKGPNNKRITLRGQKQARKFLTALQAKRLLRQGYQSYLAHVVDTNKDVPQIENIPVVKEFKDVFPDDLPGLPPDREIEFTIDLAPGTTPISKVSYRMATV